MMIVTRTSRPLHSVFHPALHHARVHQPCLLEVKAPVGEHREVRNPSHVITCREFRRSLRVDLQHHRPSCQVSRDLCNMRRRRPARSTPRRPEIHEYRYLALSNNLVKLCRVHLDWLSRRSQRSFAGTASSRIGKVLRRNSIRLPARQTLSDDGHNTILS